MKILAPCIAIAAANILLAAALTVGEISWLGFVASTLEWLVLIASIGTLALAYAMLRTLRSGDPLIHGLRQSISDNRDRLKVVAVGLAISVPVHSSSNILKQRLNDLYPFWADKMLADWDAAIFGTDPGQWLHSVLGPAAIGFLDFTYTLWFPVNALCFIACLFYGRKRLLLTYFLLWGLCAPMGQVLMSSAGPLFWPYLDYGDRFDSLIADVSFGPTFAARYLWLTFNADVMRFGAGIAAVPSMHVAGSAWVALCTFRSRLFPIGLLYLVLVSIGSVALGWHYALDGVIGIACTFAMLGVASAYYAPLRGLRPLSGDSQTTSSGRLS